MRTLSPLNPGAVINNATLMLDLRDEGRRRGSMIEAMLQRVGLPLDADWAAAFVQYAGWKAHFDNESCKSSWPLMMVGTFDELLREARRLRVIAYEPKLGDIVVYRQGGSRAYVQGGIVVARSTYGLLDGMQLTPYFDCITIEGNTNHRGMRNGGRVARVARRIVPAEGDVVIRWVDLDHRNKIGLLHEVLDARAVGTNHQLKKAA